MLKIKKISLFLVLLFSLLFFSFQTTTILAYDFETESGIGDTGYEAGYNEANLTDDSIAQIIGKVVKQIIMYLGIFFLLLTIYAGFIWMFSRGNDQEVQKAKDILEHALIGLIIIIAAYAITYFLTSILTDVQYVEN